MKIETIGDLKQYIGKIVVFSNGKGDEETSAYMGKIVKIGRRYLEPSYYIPYSYYIPFVGTSFSQCNKDVTDEDKVEKGITIYTDNVVLGTKNLITSPIYKSVPITLYDRIRTPSEEEIKTYNNKLRHYKIFGK